MRTILSRGLLAIVVGVLIVGTAQAGPITTDINLTAAANYGSITDSLSTSVGFGYFPIEGTDKEAGYYLSIYFVDTVKAAAAADSLVFNLCRRPWDGEDLDSATSAALTALPDGWISVYAFALTHLDAGNFPLTKHIPLDSTAVYPLVPGKYQWRVYGGRTTAAHRPDKAYKFKAYIEYDKAW